MRSLTFLVVTWHWSLALCRAKPQLLIIASGIFATCHTLVPHVIEGCLMYLSMPNSTLPKSSPQCPQKVNVTLFFGQNLICLAFYLGLCLVLSFVGDYVSWEERGVLFTSSISRCPYAHLFSHSFIKGSMIWLRKRDMFSVLKSVGKREARRRGPWIRWVSYISWALFTCQATGISAVSFSILSPIFCRIAKLY